MTTIVTRAGKGSALTWTEGDANITNLNNDKIEAVVDDTTPQLGGDLDVNAKNIVSTSNGNINLQPNGTGKVVVNKELEATLLRSTQSSGDEGGQINLALAATNTTLSGEVAIDINQNRLRIFETGGSNRGAYIDLSAASTGVGTNLVSAGGASTLDGLSDVVITAAANGKLLQHNGTNWVDVNASSVNVGSADSATLATTATGATNINISTTTGNANDTTLYPVLVGAASTGNQLPHIDTVLTYNASTDTLTATNFSGTASVASTVTLTADNTTNATNYPLFVNAATGNLSPRTDTGFTYNPNTGTLTATTFSGAATNIVITTNNSTDATYYPVFVSASSGNTGALVDLGLTFNPSTNGLTLASTGNGGLTAPTATLNGGTNTPKLTLSNTAVSSTAWTTAGVGLKVQTATFTDTSSLAGTVAASHVHAIAAPTMASTNAITVTDAGTLYISGAPTAGTNTTITNGWALLANGRIKATAIDNTPIGSTTASTGAFTTLSASGNATLSSTLTAGGSVGTNGQVLQSTGTGVQWATPSSSGGMNCAIVTMGSVAQVVGATNYTYRTQFTEVIDPGNFLSLTDTNYRMVLGAGTYVIFTDSVVHQIAEAQPSTNHQLYNVTNTTAVLNDFVTNRSITTNTYWYYPSKATQFTLAATGDIEYRFYRSNTFYTSQFLPRFYIFKIA